MEKLTYRNGLKRTFGLIRFGFGFGLPIYSIVRNFMSYTACAKGKTMRWDEGIQYRLLDKKRWRVFACLLSYAMCFFLIFLVFLQSHMPRYRGDITPEQYAANVNEIMYRDRNAMAINPEGRWFKRTDMRGSYHTYGYDLLPNQLTIQDGTVVGVRIAREHHSYAEKGSIPDYSGQRRLLLYAFLAAQRGINCMEIAFDPEIRQILDATKSYTFERDGVRVTSVVEYSGYTHQSYRAFSPTAGMENDYRMSFEMIRTDSANDILK